MFKTSEATHPDNDVRAIDESRECFVFLLDQMFHPQVVCADLGGNCTRIGDMMNYLTRSLEREERLMAAAGYPGLSVHKRDHAKVLQILNGMKRTLICGGYDNTLVSDILRNWSKGHDETFDKDFVDFLHERGAEFLQGRKP